MPHRRGPGAFKALIFMIFLAILYKFFRLDTPTSSRLFMNIDKLVIPGEASQGESPPRPTLSKTLWKSFITETKLPRTAVAGFTIFDRLYMRNGTLFIVTSTPDAFPRLKTILSQPKNMRRSNIDPTPLDMQIISPEEVEPLLGKRAIVMPGTSFIFWDTKQFMAHYYHWWGELILGAMRVYHSLALVPGIQLPLPEPTRFILPNIPSNGWRDHAGVNGPLMRAGWPEVPIHQSDMWDDMRALNQTVVFERAMIISRVAAHTSPLVSHWFKMISSAMNTAAPPNFWKPLQQRVVENAVGYVPLMDSRGTVISMPQSKAPIVTYISRQGGHFRKLPPGVHLDLVNALKELEEEGLCEVFVATMESMSFTRQIEAIARSTVIIGIHGNGLTHQLWMPSSPHSTIIEIFFPNSYMHDYEFLARNMGHKHYALWNDTTLTYPEGQWFEGVNYGNSKDFHGANIPVYPPAVVKVIRERLGETKS